MRIAQIREIFQYGKLFVINIVLFFFLRCVNVLFFFFCSFCDAICRFSAVNLFSHSVESAEKRKTKKNHFGLNVPNIVIHNTNMVKMLFARGSQFFSIYILLMFDLIIYQRANMY